MKEKLILGLLRGVAMLPLGVLYLISDFLYLIVYRLVRYRLKVVRRNLSEAFPHKPEKELRRIERGYYRFLCDVMVETVKLLHISAAELARRVEVKNAGEVNAVSKAGRSVVLMLGHYGNWEWVQDVSRCFTSGAYEASIYRPLRNPMWDDIFRRVRSRWHVNILPQAKAVKALLDPSHRPWICGFIADQGPRQVLPDNVTPFLNHHTSFIYGPETIGTKVGADFYFLEMERMRRGYYRITFHHLEPLADEKPYPYSRAFWQKFEEVIKRKPAYWLWSHKRWKYDPVIE